NASGFSRKFREIFSYAGSNRSERSVVNILGARFFEGSKASGTVSSPPLATHCCAPAGLFSNSHSLLKRFWKKLLLHFVGVCDQVTSGPPVIASAPTPVLYLLCQPRP